MTVYLMDGMFLQRLLGPLSDHIGHHPVMLVGMVWFIITCLTILLAQNIKQFILLRSLQGISLRLIDAAGYVAIQESFEEAVCIKIAALMADMALIAPLLGLLVGTAWIYVLPWEEMFILFVTLATISFFGLQQAMPEAATRIDEKLSLKELGRDYKLVLKNGRSVAGALALGFVSLPLLAWIAQSSIITITGRWSSSCEYGLLQVPIFGALIAGNLLSAHLTSRRIVRSLVIMGGWPIIIGLLVAAAVTVISLHTYLQMTARLGIYASGIGPANARLVQLTPLTSGVSEDTVSVAIGMLQMLIFTVSTEISKHAWLNGGNGLFNLFSLASGVLWLSLMVILLKNKQMGNPYEG